MNTPPPYTHRRLSLTWRVIALSSLLLLLLVLAFTWLGHQNLIRQFQESRLAQYERLDREVRLALQRSEAELLQLATLVAATPALGPGLAEGDPAILQDSLASQWPSLQLDAGIDEILVLDKAGRSLGAWGDDLAGQDRSLHDWAHQAIVSESPLATLRCTTDCRQYAAVPVLQEGDSVGLVLLSRSLADVTRQLQQVSGSEVALLISSRLFRQGQDDERYLEAWGGRLVALTHQEVTLPLLHRATAHASPQGLVAQPLTLSQGQQEMELVAVRLDEDEDLRSTGYFVMASDITAQTRAIHQDTRTLLLAGVGGWLAAELLLLAILLRPMARLRRLAGVLPILAHGGFNEVRRTIPRPVRRLADEIDVLEETTLALSTQLEHLQQEVSARDEQLAERIGELARERDFVNSLLDTARVFIVTQDDQGRIGLVNEHALAAMATQEALLRGRLFEDVFGPPQVTLQEGDAPQEERTLRTADGERTITWYHAPLALREGGDARISVGLDITERKRAEARLTWLAERDPLTGLYNRRHFNQALAEAMANDRQGAVLLLDLDQFKEINELSGHHAGDRLLRNVAETLRQEFAHRSLIARLGGDEFALLLEDADALLAQRVARQIPSLLEGIRLDAGGQCHRASASIGIALFPAHGRTPTDLMASADLAMYKAKENSVQRWHQLSTVESARDELQERVYWVERIRQALETDAFELMTQPIVRLTDRSIGHYEVLLRMRNDDGSLVSPALFIPQAERSGQITQIDRWVIRHGLAALKALEARQIGLAINLSGQSLHDDGLRQFLADELKASGADPSRLILEVTETAAVTDFATARGVLQSLRDLGCRTALDDFGVGFSSFHYLGQLPVDYIKIDGSFIRNLLINAESRVIVKAIADIAAGFGKEAIAEFVDQEALLPLLESYGIGFGQGFHLGHPTPLRDTFWPAPGPGR